MKHFKKFNTVLSRLSLFLTLSLLLALLPSCARPVSLSESQADTLKDEPLQTVDGSQDYIGSFIFLGESTTYHLKSRGVLEGGTDTLQVWAPPSGTVNLDLTVDSLKIVYPETGELLTLSEAVSRKQPQRMLLCFGLNGAVTKIKRGEEYFHSCYMKLIDTVRSSSPQTEIILASCYPISKSMDVSAYTVDAVTLNSYITQINGWTRSLSLKEGLGFVDLASPIRDSEGFLLPEFDAGDGYHLNGAAYLCILERLRESEHQ